MLGGAQGGLCLCSIVSGSGFRAGGTVWCRQVAWCGGITHLRGCGVTVGFGSRFRPRPLEKLG